MVREVAYDEVFDAQKHFRSLLDSMARPGKINRLDPVHLTPPLGLNVGSVLVAFALLDSDSPFSVVNMDSGEAAYLVANTNARRAETEHAHFVFARGTEPAEFLDDVDCGTLLYPDTAATVVLQIDEASTSPLVDGLRLTLDGPGIEGTTTIHVRGLSKDVLLAVQARNTEFPLGVDTILTFADPLGAPCLVALPRTTRVAWEAR